MGFPVMNTGMGCHFLLQGIFPTQGSNPGPLPCRQILYRLSHQASSIPSITPLSLLQWCCPNQGRYLRASTSLIPSFFTTVHMGLTACLRRNINIVHTGPRSQRLYLLVQFSCSVVSDSLRPRELQHARPPCPSPTPGVYSNSCPLSP